ncbi:MATH domain and coiled-coil domain-containing protein At3g58210-like [Coffea arabica]|uniref:MATH domain and coiled-coil domain-containing protein At3g58210-like n=1 Tax=Coffea arabica TaxID=13443 RepID=A0A6P6TYG6_COFAR|nr:MATH domain and coiled-coil domain-containing protein At3g58210-like [Coffea arabica]
MVEEKSNQNMPAADYASDLYVSVSGLFDVFPAISANLKNGALFKRDSGIYTYNIVKFSKLKQEFLHSDAFVVGNCNWKLEFYPKGFGQQKGKSFSLYLLLAEPKNDIKTYAEYKLSIKNPKPLGYAIYTGTSWFSSTNPSCGSDNILSLKEVHNSSRGFLEKDAMVVQAEISEVAKKL